MLPGFLTTALEIIIILDICGAIAYFTITGLTRKNKPTRQATPLQPTPAFGQLVERMKKYGVHILTKLSLKGV